TGGGSIEITLGPVLLGRSEGVEVNERVVEQDARVIGGDKAHAAHVGRQGVNMFDPLCCLQAVFPAAQVQEGKIISLGDGKFRMLEVHTSHPAAKALEVGNQMMPNKTARSRHQYARALLHVSTSVSGFC